jgi:hypothetical protein
LGLLALAATAAYAGVAAADSIPPRPIAPDLVPPAAADSASDSAARSAVVAPSKDRPYGARRRDARDWLACLAATAALSDGLVEAAEQRAREAVGRRLKTNKLLPQTFAKSLDLVDADWRNLRDRECDALAFFENAPPGPIYERRLNCHIRLNLGRAGELDQNYGDGG